MSLYFLRRASPPLRIIMYPLPHTLPLLALCLATLQARHRTILCPSLLRQGTYAAGFTPCRCLAIPFGMGRSPARVSQRPWLSMRAIPARTPGSVP
jgi:hypothetical protein